MRISREIGGGMRKTCAGWVSNARKTCLGMRGRAGVPFGAGRRKRGNGIDAPVAVMDPPGVAGKPLTGPRCRGFPELPGGGGGPFDGVHTSFQLLLDPDILRLLRQEHLVGSAGGGIVAQ